MFLINLVKSYLIDYKSFMSHPLNYHLDYLGIKHHLSWLENQPNSSHCLASEFLPSQKNNINLYKQLENTFSTFYNYEDAALFKDYVIAIQEAIRLYSEDGVKIYIEASMKPSWLEQLDLSSATVYYDSNDMKQLEHLIQHNGSGIIISRSLSPLTGRYVSLNDLCNFRDKYDCFLIIDETFTLGLVGDNGKGLVNLNYLNNRVDIIIVDLLPVFQNKGSMVLGHSLWIAYLKDKSKHYNNFTMAKIDLIQLTHNFSIVKGMERQRSKLSKTASYIYSTLGSKGLIINATLPSHIISLNIKLNQNPKSTDIINNLIKNQHYKGISVDINETSNPNHLVFCIHLSTSATMFSIDSLVNEILKLNYLNSYF